MTACMVIRGNILFINRTLLKPGLMIIIDMVCMCSMAFQSGLIINLSVSLISIDFSWPLMI